MSSSVYLAPLITDSLITRCFPFLSPLPSSAFRFSSIGPVSGHFLARRLLPFCPMDAMVHSLVPGGLSLLALTTVVGLVRLQRSVTNTRAPVSDRLLRSPGESLRARLERIDEKLMW